MTPPIAAEEPAAEEIALADAGGLGPPTRVAGERVRPTSHVDRERRARLRERRRLVRELAALRDDGDRPIDIVLERLHDRRRWIARGARRKRRLFEADDVPHHAYCGCGGDWPRCAEPANYAEP